MFSKSDLVIILTRIGRKHSYQGYPVHKVASRVSVLGCSGKAFGRVQGHSGTVRSRQRQTDAPGCRMWVAKLLDLQLPALITLCSLVIISFSSPEHTCGNADPLLGIYGLNGPP